MIVLLIAGSALLAAVVYFALRPRLRAGPALVLAALVGVAAAGLMVTRLIGMFASSPPGLAEGEADLCGDRPRISASRPLTEAQALSALYRGDVREGAVEHIPDEAQRAQIRALLGDAWMGGPLITTAPWSGPLRHRSQRIWALATRSALDAASAHRTGAAALLGLALFAPGPEGGWCVLGQTSAAGGLVPDEILLEPQVLAVGPGEEGILLRGRVQVGDPGHGLQLTTGTLIAAVDGPPRLVASLPLAEADRRGCDDPSTALSPPGPHCYAWEAEISFDSVAGLYSLEAQGAYGLWRRAAGTLAGGLSFTDEQLWRWDGQRLEPPPSEGPAPGGTPVSEKRLVLSEGRCTVREMLGDGGHPVSLPEEVARALRCDGPTTALAPDHRILAWIDGDTLWAFDFLAGIPVRLWELPPARRGISAPAFSPDGRRLALGILDEGGPRVGVFDVIDGELRRRMIIAAPLRFTCRRSCAAEIGVDLGFARRGILMYRQDGTEEGEDGRRLIPLDL